MATDAGLYIKRVATVVSMAQLSAAADEPASGATPRVGAEAPVASIGGTRIALYSFAPDAAAAPPRLAAAANGASNAAPAAAGEDGAPPLFGADAASTGQLLRGPQEPALAGRSLLDGLLLAMWEDAAGRGLFRYDVTACPTKVLPGSYGFVAQLNEGRATKKRPTEFRIDQVCQPFDPAKFNFNKAAVKEVLFAFEPAAPGARGASFSEDGRVGASPSLVLINVSPIDYGHVLLCPRVLDCLPQLLDRESTLLALRYAREAGNPYLRVGYNSLGAYATINHLHFQSYYLNTPMPIERAPTAALRGLARRRDGVRVSRLSGYPVNAWVLEGGDLGALADAVMQAAVYLQDHNVPHNMLISDCGGRVFLVPQCYAEKQAKGQVPEHLLATGVNPAVWEITGHMVLFRPDDYAAFSQDLAWELLAAISLPDDAFLALSKKCFGACHVEEAAAAAAAAGAGAAPAARRCSECGAPAAAGGRASAELAVAEA